MVPDNVLHYLYYVLVYLRITYAICAWISAYPTALKDLKSSVKKAIRMQSTPPNRLGRYFPQYDEVYKYFILCTLFKVICDGKYLHCVNKMDQH